MLGEVLNGMNPAQTPRCIQVTDFVPELTQFAVISILDTDIVIAHVFFFPHIT